MGETPENKGDDVASDEAIVRRIRAGDARAMQTLHDRLLPLLRHQVRRQLPGSLRRKVAESDVIQEAFLKALERLEDFEDRGDGSFRAWLGVILERRLIDEYRRFFGTAKRDLGRERSHPGQASPHPGPQRASTPSEFVAGKELVGAMLDAVESLSDAHRTILTLVHFKGLSLADAAIVMDRSADAVRKLYGRAVLSLRAELGEEAS